MLGGVLMDFLEGETAMVDPVLKVEGLRKSYSGVVAVDDVSFDIRPNEIHAIIGPNGAGKTTLISLLDGSVAVDAGTIVFRGSQIQALVGHARARMGLIRSFQITSIFPEMTVLENVALAVQVRLANAYWHLWRSVGDDARIIAPAHSYLQIVGLGRRASCIANTMSHGERRLLEIAIALATEPLLLLLDEPMAGLGPEESSSMLTLIEGLRRDYAVLLVEHDMDAVFTLADRISVMVYGKKIRTGYPDEIRADSKIREAYLGNEESFDA
jgi:branched-chain amino acid transport system ATP-binding protein